MRPAFEPHGPLPELPLTYQSKSAWRCAYRRLGGRSEKDEVLALALSTVRPPLIKPSSHQAIKPPVSLLSSVASKASMQPSSTMTLPPQLGHDLHWHTTITITCGRGN